MNRRAQLWFSISTSALLIVAIVVFRPTETKGIPSKKYWALKILNSDAYDFIAAGDSRVMNGISPAVMSQIFPGLKIFNFSFSGLGYSNEYLDFIEHHLRADGVRIVLLGITPSSLREKSAAKNGFLFYKSASRSELFFARYIAGFLSYFEPTPISELYHHLMNKKVFHEETCYADGWVAKRRVPLDPTAAVYDYTVMFQEEPVSKKVIQLLAERVAKWTQAGIVVYGIRLPGSPEIRDLEERIGQFDERVFVQQFTQAGGRWLAVSSDDYKTTDGCHLEGESAEKFSADIAHVMELNSKR